MTLRMKGMFALLIVFLAFDVVALRAVLTARQSSAVAISGKVVSHGAAAIGGPFTLTSSDGRTVTDQTYRGKWMVIYFGYTFCPDACPTALSNMSAALQKLGKKADQIQPLFITIDPQRDTPQVVTSYLTSFDPRFAGLIGSQPQTEAIMKSYRVYAEPHKEGGENYLIDHSAYFYIMSPDGKFVDVVEGAAPGDEIADKLRRLLDGYSASE